MNVNLWFARENDNEIVGILNSNSNNDYSCPICSSKVIPKAVESNKVTPHFAHIDVSKCSSEAMIHWWYKHKFIDRGDTFKISTDEEIEFTCRDFDTEVTYQLDSGTYRPDLVIYTECGQEVIFEMANSNKKKVQDYIDKWIELNRIIVEVDIKTLQSEDDIKVLKALYYKGKCFNFNKRDGGYYNTIGKLKEEMKSNGCYDVEMVRKLDWFWKDLMEYIQNNDKQVFQTVTSILDNKINRDIIKSILKSHNLSNLMYEYVSYLENELKDVLFNKYSESFDINIEYNFYPNYLYSPEKFKMKTNYSDICSSDLYINDLYTNHQTVIDAIDKLKWKVNVKEYLEEVNAHLAKDYENLDLNYYFHGDICEIKINSKKDKYSGKYLSFRKGEEFKDIAVKVQTLIHALNNSTAIKSIGNKIDRNNYINKLNEKIKDCTNSSKYEIGYTLNDNFTVSFDLFYDNTFVDSMDLEMDYIKKVNINHLSKILVPYFHSITRDIKTESKYIRLYNTLELKKWKLNIESYHVGLQFINKEFRLFLVNELSNEMYPITILSNDKVNIENITLDEDTISNTKSFIREIERFILLNKGVHCVQCNGNFKMKNSEYNFFIDKGFELPRRCKPCRQKRKQDKKRG